MLRKLICRLFGHVWKKFPTRPYTTYICNRCIEVVDTVEVDYL